MLQAFFVCSTSWSPPNRNRNRHRNRNRQRILFSYFPPIECRIPFVRSGGRPMEVRNGSSLHFSTIGKNAPTATPMMNRMAGHEILSPVENTFSATLAAVSGVIIVIASPFVICSTGPLPNKTSSYRTFTVLYMTQLYLYLTQPYSTPPLQYST